ncbi:MAG: NAD(P)H-hydrate dehydratase [Fusobacteriia bacterium 4572_74]|nr:MAG: NAD(P)H-hydrate dehydratase [Fusobacteriia bacterium 4572_74]
MGKKLEKKDIVLKKRDLEGYKGDYGHVIVIGGSQGFTGAPVITANSAVRSGAGLVTLCIEDKIENVVVSNLLEAMSCVFSNETKIKELLKNAAVIALGPGMGKKKTLDILKYTLDNSTCPLVIDADGINVLHGNMELLRGKKVVLTPHLGEFSRLTGLDIEEIKKDRLNIVKKFAQSHDVILLLKGHRTLITDGREVYINTSGNPVMANGGMGDSLTGIIASLIAQGYDVLEAACIGTYIHGFIGDELSKERFCITARDIIEHLPIYMKKFQK